MKNISPEAITESRVYFTEFDRVTYSQVAWSFAEVEYIRRSLERKLKLVALIKGHVVVAASHLLESELAREILFHHPRLFSEGVIVPALRSEFASFEEYLDSKIADKNEGHLYEGEFCRDMARMLDSEVALTIKWDVKQTTGWFKERILSDLRDEYSLLRSYLRGSGVLYIPQTLCSKIEELSRPSRQDVYMLARETGDKELWNILCMYTDFVYYLSGAKAVCSEGVLPQENLLDFSLSDLAGGRTNLSDTEIFFKMFVDLVKAATNTHFPVDLLDTLSIDDVLELHLIAVEEKFVEKYNHIQEMTKKGLEIHDSERLILLMDELEQYERQLHDDYRSAIDKELPRYQRDIRMRDAAKFLNATASMIIPPWGMINGAKDVIISGLELSRKDDINKRMRNRIEHRINACSRLLDRTCLDGKPVLLEFIKNLQKRYANKMLAN